MSTYNERVKNFEKIREMMREFYVYGFKSRDEYDQKSARSYDDERRRMESWLGDHMRFVRTPEGKTVFISIDSRVSQHNPFYKALKAKSFTDGDITLHFMLFDILHAPSVCLSLPEILEAIDTYLSAFECPMVFDESTVRKKLQEYARQGMIETEKDGRKLRYRRAADLPPTDWTDALHFFSEAAPCGVVGSFLLDKQDACSDWFGFKHHYMTDALDSDVLATLFVAMREKRAVTATTLVRRDAAQREVSIVPLKVFISTQNGRQHLLAYRTDTGIIHSLRIDYLSNVRPGDVHPQFDELRARLETLRPHMWGVTAKMPRNGKLPLDRVEFTVCIDEGERYIVHRLEREKRCGQVEKIDEHTYRFTADVFDAGEMVPWIRTFICRITDLHISNTAVEQRFKQDLEQMYRMYGIGEVTP